MLDGESWSGRLAMVLLATLASGLAGCGIRRPGIYQAGNWGPSTFLEDGRQVSLYTLQCENVHVTNFGYSPTTEYRSILTEEPAKWARDGYDHTNARRLWDTTPAWRREDDLIAVGKRLTADQPKQAKRVLISSHNPVVVGVSDQPDPVVPDADPFYNFLFFLGRPPLQHHGATVTRLYLCRSWPQPNSALGVPSDREVIILPRPTSTNELMQTRPWNQPTTAPTTGHSNER